MNPLIKIALGLFAAFGISKLFSSDDDTSGIAGIKVNNIDNSNLLEHNRNSDEPNLRRAISQRINSIVNGSKKFKIGKTGNPKGRAGSYEKGYNKMFLLCVSQDAEYINNLESTYNSKYITDPKNGNINEGSARKMESPDGKFYLYVATN